MKYYLETYGCQMNEADSEIVAQIIERKGYRRTDEPQKADLILVNSCTVREKAESRAIARLSQFKGYKKDPEVKLGLLGCAVERGKDKIKEEYPFIDILLGPDSYREFDKILEEANYPYQNFSLSNKELYEGISPQRTSDLNGWISIMRGCNQFCSYCIVPYTRGRERSKPLDTILKEAEEIAQEGIPQITLIGQNVNAYDYADKGFGDVLEEVARIKDIERIRYISPHPSDFNTRMIEIMAEYDKICNHIHLPLQAGSNRVLEKMNRNYTKEEFLDLVENIRSIIPEVALTTDIIVGFPGEKEEDYQETLEVMEKVEFDNAFMFQYSSRPGTYAAKNMEDDIPYDIKNRRLEEVSSLQRKHSLEKNEQLIGQNKEVLIEGQSKKNKNEPVGRTEEDKLVIIKSGQPDKGEFINVKIKDIAGVSLFGTSLE